MEIQYVLGLVIIVAAFSTFRWYGANAHLQGAFRTCTAEYERRAASATNVDYGAVRHKTTGEAFTVFYGEVSRQDGGTTRRDEFLCVVLSAKDDSASAQADPHFLYKFVVSPY
jgi:hypothetical protein